MTDVDELILKELSKLNATLEKLTDEHITHFKEWRVKNRS